MWREPEFEPTVIPEIEEDSPSGADEVDVDELDFVLVDVPAEPEDDSAAETAEANPATVSTYGSNSSSEVDEAADQSQDGDGDNGIYIQMADPSQLVIEGSDHPVEMAVSTKPAPKPKRKKIQKPKKVRRRKFERTDSSFLNKE